MHFEISNTCSNFSGNEILCKNFLYLGSFDPQRMTGGARGHVGRPGWPSRLGQRPAWPAPSHRRGSAGDGATVRQTEGGRGPGGPEAHREPAGRSPGSEDGRRQRIWPAKSSVSGEESTTVAVISATMAQFIWQGGRGRRWGSSQQVRGARESAERRL
jgi:hypothetical protein